MAIAHTAGGRGLGAGGGRHGRRPLGPPGRGAGREPELVLLREIPVVEQPTLRTRALPSEAAAPLNPSLRCSTLPPSSGILFSDSRKRVAFCHLRKEG